MLYQLVAVGVYKSFNQQGKIYSKKVFVDREKAEAYMERFKANCCGNGLYDLEPERTTVKLVELELVE